MDIKSNLVQHNVTYAKLDSLFFCKCGANQDGSCIALNLPQTSKLCTKIATNHDSVKQHVYRCNTCEMKEVCSRCAKNCHESHELDYGEFTSTYCDCECVINEEELIFSFDAPINPSMKKQFEHFFLFHFLPSFCFSVCLLDAVLWNVCPCYM